MKDCLKTMLKATFDNNNLPILGFEKIRIPGVYDAYQNQLGFLGRIVGTTTDCEVDPGDHTGDVDVSDAWLSIKNTANPGTAAMLYDIHKSNILFGMFDFTDDLQKSSDILGINAESVVKDGVTYRSTGDVKLIKKKYPNLKYLKMQSASNFYGTVAEVFDELTSLEIASVYNANHITGSLEELATSQIAKGRTSGTLTIACNEVITYNGSVVGQNVKKVITFSGSSYTITDPA